MKLSQAKQLRQNPRIKAFLDMIGEAEGAGYRTLVHKGTKNAFIKDLSKHPGVVVKTDAHGKVLPKHIWSSAAGKYQILSRTWLNVARALDLKDFGEESQDLAAIYLLWEKGAIEPILKGDIKTAIQKVSKTWASFPGANYAGQGMRKESQLISWYNAALGLANDGAKLAADNPGTSSLVILLLIIGGVLLLKN